MTEQSHFTPFPKEILCDFARIDGHYVDLAALTFREGDRVAAICSDNKIRIVTLDRAPDPDEGARLGAAQLSLGQTGGGRFYRSIEDITIIGLVIGGQRGEK